MAHKDEKEFILSELAIAIDADKLISVLYRLEDHIPEKESRELDAFLKNGKKLLEKILSAGPEEYDPKKHMAFKTLGTETENFRDYRYLVQYSWYNIRYYQDGMLCRKKPPTETIFLSPWEPKSKEIIQKITNSKKRKTTISKNKDANIKRQEKMFARMEMGRKISPKEEFANMIIKENEWHKKYFYAAQWNAYFGLPIPMPDELKKVDIGFVKQSIYLKELREKYPPPFKSIHRDINVNNINHFWYAKEIIDFCQEVGHPLSLSTTTFDSEERAKEVKNGFLDKMKNPDFAKKVQELNHYYQKIQPTINSLRNDISQALSYLGLECQYRDKDKAIYLLSDEAIRNTIQYLENETVSYDYSWKNIMFVANKDKCQDVCPEYHYFMALNINDIANLPDCSARRVLEAWGILTKKESDVA